MKPGSEPTPGAATSYPQPTVTSSNPKKKKTPYSSLLQSLCLLPASLLFPVTQWTLVGRCIFVTISGQFTVLTLSKANLQTEATCPAGPTTLDLAGLEACGRSIFITRIRQKQFGEIEFRNVL